MKNRPSCETLPRGQSQKLYPLLSEGVGPRLAGNPPQKGIEDAVSLGGDAYVELNEMDVVAMFMAFRHYTQERRPCRMWHPAFAANVLS
jgi:hypothetical protein